VSIGYLAGCGETGAYTADLLPSRSISPSRTPGAVVLAIEVKYEPAAGRPDLVRADGIRPERVTFGTEIRRDIAIVEELVRDGVARAAVALLLDEGSRLSLGALAGSGAWETWDELARGNPGWLRPRVLRVAFGT
jgi:hypothetical protein